MAEFIEVAEASKVPVGTGATFTVKDKQVAIFNVDGTLYAMGDTCLHAGASLGSGKLEGKIVTCRAHGWRYNVTTSNTLNVPDYGTGCYQVKVVDGKILISLPELT